MSDNNKLVADGLQEIRRRLPEGWKLEEQRGRTRGARDTYARIVAPDRRSASLAVEARRQLDPRAALGLLAQLREARAAEPVLVMARYLSPSVRERLREGEVSFVDLAGNARVVLQSPGLFIEAAGADRNPDRKQRPARSLRGAKAGRLARALIDFRDPPGVRELALRAKVDAGYASRILALLDGEALISRVGRGRIERVDWARLLRRWAQDAPFESRGRTVSFIEPRGLPALLERLAKSTMRYAVTGSAAAARIAPVAPSRLATLYVTDARAAAEQLGLRVADAGANVLLVEASDEGVFERARTGDGISYAAPSQVAADLLTSPGRAPAEAEELIAWMAEHEEEWRG